MSIKAGGDLPDNYVKGQQSPTTNHPYPIYSNGTEGNALYGYSDNYKIDDEVVTVSASGTIGHHAIRSPKFTPIVRLIVLKPKLDLLTPSFLNHVLDITTIRYDTAGVSQLTVPNISKVKIPIPPLKTQRRISAILGCFEKLTHDISEGLPSELNARRQQYEYYRDKLLTFQEVGA